MANVKINDREYISLSLPFFKAAMQNIHDSNEFDEDYIPKLENRVIRFTQFQGDFEKALVTKDFMKWMEQHYDLPPLPWRPADSKGDKVNVRQSQVERI